MNIPVNGSVDVCRWIEALDFVFQLFMGLGFGQVFLVDQDDIGQANLVPCHLKPIQDLVSGPAVHQGSNGAELKYVSQIVEFPQDIGRIGPGPWFPGQ